MGNVLCASSSMLAVPASEATEGVKTYPGTFEDLHKKCKECFPNIMDGMLLLVNKGLSNHFQVSHKLNLSQGVASNYHFGATYVGTKQYTLNEAFPILLGEIDSSGSLNAQIIHAFLPSVKSKVVVQTQKDKFQMVQAELEYHGDDFSASGVLVNPDIIQASALVLGHYFQAITKHLALGAELLATWGQGQDMSLVSLAGQYKTEKWIAAASVNVSGGTVSYWHKGNDKVHVGVEMETNLRSQESTVSLGYHIDVPEVDMSFKGTVDTNWTVGAVLEKKLQPLPFTFALSGAMNHKKNACRFGVSLMVG